MHIAAAAATYRRKRAGVDMLRLLYFYVALVKRIRCSWRVAQYLSPNGTFASRILPLERVMN
jgi:hypothetical protein